MRLSEPIETSGAFWLPEEPDTEFSGVLRISEAGSITLEIQGGFVSYIEQKAVRIVGKTDRLGAVTLERCYYQTISRGGITKKSFQVDSVFVGVHYCTDETLTFEEVTFSLEGLDEWLAISGIKFGEKPKDWANGSWSIHFQLPRPISLALTDDIDLEFNFGAQFSPVQLPTNTRASVEQRSYVTLKLKEQKPFDELRYLAIKIRNFLSFATSVPVSIQTFTARTEQITRERQGIGSEPYPINVYFRSPHHLEKPPRVGGYQMLFRLPDVEDNIECIVNDWLRNYEMLRPTFDLYFSSSVEYSSYLEVRFTGLVQALEALHRRTSDETVMPQEEFNSIRDSLLSDCPSKRREWLEIRLKYDNELSLGQRLKRLVAPFRQWFGNNTERESLIRKVVDTRNYLTHYDQSLLDKAANGQELHDLCEKLDALVQLNLLRYLGFQNNDIEAIVSRPHSPLRWKL